MRYEYKQDFESFTKGVISAPAVETGYRQRLELEDVYRKATLYDRDKAKIRAFDDIVAAYENNTGLGEHDEDLTDFEAIVDSIDHGIQMVGYRENEEEQE